MPQTKGYYRPNADMYYHMRTQGFSVDTIAKRYNVKKGDIWRGCYEYKKHLQLKGLNSYNDIQEKLPMRQIEKPVVLHGDCVVIGDVQLPTTDYEFIQRPLQIAELYLERPRTCIIAGDLINADAFSNYDEDLPTNFALEIQSAKRFIEDYLTVFDRVVWFMGNHERRVPRKSKGAITPALLKMMLSSDNRLEVSAWGHCVVKTEQGDYRITHARNYSINQLTVADSLAQKYGQHIINHHEHHLAKGWDRYGRYVVVNNGGLFNQEDMTYVVLDDSKNANMKVGFTLIKDGVATIFGKEPFTNWQMYDDAWGQQ